MCFKPDGSLNELLHGFEGEVRQRAANLLFCSYFAGKPPFTGLFKPPHRVRDARTSKAPKPFSLSRRGRKWKIETYRGSRPSSGLRPRKQTCGRSRLRCSLPSGDLMPSRLNSAIFPLSGNTTETSTGVGRRGCSLQTCGPRASKWWRSVSCHRLLRPIRTFTTRPTTFRRSSFGHSPPQPGATSALAFRESTGRHT